MSNDQTDAWQALVSATVWLSAAMDLQLQRDAGISSFEYGVMSGLARQADRTMRIKDLALFVNSALSRMSKVLNRLERHGWLERHPDPHDGRTTLVVLTDNGRRKVASATPGHVDLIRRLVFDQVSPDQLPALAAIAAKIAQAAGPEGASAARWG